MKKLKSRVTGCITFLRHYLLQPALTLKLKVQRTLKALDTCILKTLKIGWERKSSIQTLKHIED